MPAGPKHPNAELVMQYWDFSDSSRAHHKLKWDKNWLLYIQDYDFSWKAPWQARAAFPKVPMMVNFMAWQMHKSLRAAGKFFVMEANSPAAKHAARAGELLVRNAWQSREVNINRKIANNTVSAMLCSSCIWKVYYRNGLRVAEVDPYDYWVDPTNRDRYSIHRTVMDWDKLKAMADEGHYDTAAVKRLQGGSGQTEEWDWRNRAGLAIPTPGGVRNEHEVLEMWGDLVDADGKLVMENGWIVIGDRREVLRGPDPNPYKDGQRPFIRVQPLHRPHAPYGGSPITDIQDWAEEYTQLGNLAIDAVKLESIPGYEVDIHNARHPHRLKSRGIYPGVILEKHSGTGPLITPIDKGHGTANSAINLFQLLGREMENQTSVTQFITGATGSGPDRTATEMNLKHQQSGEFLMALADAFQEDGIGPMAEMSLSRIAQYLPAPMYRTDQMVDLLGAPMANQLAMMEDDMRYHYLTTQHRVRGRGISAMFTRSEDLSRIIQFMNAVQMFPEYRSRIDTDALMQKVIEGLGWDSQEILLSEAEMKQKEAAIAMEQAVQAQQGQQGQQPPGGPRGGAGTPWQSPVEKPIPQMTSAMPGNI